jgi:hypothetical protein
MWPGLFDPRASAQTSRCYRAGHLAIRPAVHRPEDQQEHASEEEVHELRTRIASRERACECESGQHRHRSHDDVPALVFRVTQLHSQAMPG